MRIFLLVLFCSLVLHSSGQIAQQKYLDAKYYYGLGVYDKAINGFSTLTSDPTFGAYATFYLGLSQYQAGEARKGLDALGQLQVKYPAFKQMDEVNFWRTLIFFESGDYVSALNQGKKLQNNESKKSLYSKYLEKESFGVIRTLVEKFPNDELLINALAYVGVRSQLSNEERKYMSSLVSDDQVELVSSSDFPLIKKEKYVIAVLLPFMFDGMTNADRVIRNTLVMDLYQGMELASEMLGQDNKPIELVPYDTRKDKKFTETILTTKDLNRVDLVVGPLFPEPIDVVNDFSLKNRLNVINPVTSNRKVFETNDMAFTLKPSYETMAQKAAQFMANKAKKQEVMVYFENKSPEREMAEAYAEAIQELGFSVSEFNPIENTSSRQLLAKFSNQREITLKISDEEAVRLKYEGRQIRSRSKFNADGKVITKEDGSPELEYYELVYTFNTKSLDHIFAATRSNVIANNFVGAVESNPDSVRLLGLSDWLEFTMLDYKQLERLRISMIHPDYLDSDNDFLKEVQKRFQSKFKRMPSNFHLLGFESVWWAGQMMHKHGKYFQNGFFESNDFPSVFYGHEFLPEGHDNQRVPIIQFQNKQLKEVNLINESSQK